MKNLIAAVLKVMAEVKGIDKSMTVGKGQNSYKGVADKDVKKIIGESMAKNELIILPIGTKARSEVSRWEETGQYGTKQKQSIFTEVETKYLLIHSSGESIELSGYGHGVDSQDKGAGKATTYALKYALLYTFLVPTGKIDDADNIHSDEIETPKQVSQQVVPPKRKLTQDQIASIPTSDDLDRLQKVLRNFTLEPEQKAMIELRIQQLI